jgi:hypothetical protein
MNKAIKKNLDLNSNAEHKDFHEKQIDPQLTDPELENSTSSTNPLGAHPPGLNTTHHPESSIYPQESVLEMMVQYAGERSEAAESFLIGSFMPVLAGCVARRAFFSWGGHPWYPNIYSMIVGSPGDRKTDALNYARMFVRGVIPPNRLLTGNFSKEALFDEYDESSGGSPDKLWLVPEGNVVMDTWKNDYGQKVASQFLQLYDCDELSESFKRNAVEEGNGTGRRIITDTSTSVVIATTFSACHFPSKSIESGLHRRFLFFLGGVRSKIIHLPPPEDFEKVTMIKEALSRLIKMEKTACHLSDSALAAWRNYQEKNRANLDTARSEQHKSRLNSSPNHVMKVAMIFALSQWCLKGYSVWDGVIDGDTMQLASEFVDHAAESANLLDISSQKERLEDQCEVIMAKIAESFGGRVHDGKLRLTKTDLTSKFCHHSGRPGGLTPHELYAKLIPMLQSQGVAKIAERSGKRVVYEFLVER